MRLNSILSELWAEWGSVGRTGPHVPVSRCKFASVTSLLVHRDTTAYSTSVPSASESSSIERRRLPRKVALMRAVVASVNGDNVFDCMIRDMNTGGAQIDYSKTLSVGEEVYLLDIGNRGAHLAKVVWTNSDRAGLSFLKSYAVGLGLPLPLKFLWRLLLEAKLKEIDRAIRQGIPVGLAFSTVGLAEEDLHRLTPYAAGDEKFELLLLLAKRLQMTGTS